MGDPLPAPIRRAPIPYAGLLLEPFYALAVARRNARFDVGRGVERFDDGAGGSVPVISIGNLSVGGTGKTPLVMHVLQKLAEHGIRPCVAMRGYTKSAKLVPDETDAYRRAFPEVPIVAQPDRVAGVRKLLNELRKPAAERRATPGIDCIVLDDGFQHRKIARDLDVVLMDATPGRCDFEDRMLPAGWLRESVWSLRRAGAVVMTHAELANPEHIEDMRGEIRRITKAPIAVTRHVWTGLHRRVGEKDELLPLDTLIGQLVVGCCAIGHPQAFVNSLESTCSAGGASSDRVGLLIYPDHDPLGPDRVKALVGMAKGLKADYIVVTDKDWSKLRALPDSTWPCPIVRPQLAIAFDSGRDDFDRLVLGTVGNAGKGT